MRLAIIGNPENRRVAQYCAAAERMGFDAPAVISYVDCLRGNVPLHLPDSCVLKIESPGENEQVKQMLVASGLQEDYVENQAAAEFGAIGNMRAWYAGYSKWLGHVAELLRLRPDVKVMNRPADIALQFNKPLCQEWLQQCGIPIPRKLPAISGYSHLLQLMAEHGLWRVFIKPAHSSSASGVVAFRKSGRHVQAITPVELVRENGEVKIYNSLKVRTYSDEGEIATLIGRLAGEHIYAEEWLPKAMMGGRPFDVRVLAIGGRARHAVVRTTKGVITNLHLGNSRASMDSLERLMGAQVTAAINELAVRVAGCFPASLYMGVDILVTAGVRKRCVVLEVNAFGDLLPGLEHEGQTCYEAEIQEAAKER